LCAISGGVLGHILGKGGPYSQGHDEYAVFGLVIGAVFGILTDILGGGLIATFLSMDEKLQSIDTKLQRLKTSTNNNTEKTTGYFTDTRDGQKYRTVKIGDKTWMAQNLNYQPPTGNSWCYDNDNSNGDKYGRLYDWNTAKTACPAGWHLPTREEWNDLVTAAGGKVAGQVLKSATSYWKGGGNGTDNYGFSALPGGKRDSDGSFDDIGSTGYWWTAKEDGNGRAYFRYMDSGSDSVDELNYGKSYGFSVRCVAD